MCCFNIWGNRGSLRLPPFKMPSHSFPMNKVPQLLIKCISCISCSLLRGRFQVSIPFQPSYSNQPIRYSSKYQTLYSLNTRTSDLRRPGLFTLFPSVVLVCFVCVRDPPPPGCMSNELLQTSPWPVRCPGCGHLQNPSLTNRVMLKTKISFIYLNTCALSDSSWLGIEPSTSFVLRFNPPNNPPIGVIASVSQVTKLWFREVN